MISLKLFDQFRNNLLYRTHLSKVILASQQLIMFIQQSVCNSNNEFFLLFNYPSIKYNRFLSILAIQRLRFRFQLGVPSILLWEFQSRILHRTKCISTIIQKFTNETFNILLFRSSTILQLFSTLLCIINMFRYEMVNLSLK